MQAPDIENLSSSWTKYDSVKVVEIAMANDLEKAMKGEVNVNDAVLRNFLGVKSLNDPLPDYWRRIYHHPRQLGPFALMSAIFIHHRSINWFAHTFSQGNMGGLF